MSRYRRLDDLGDAVRRSAPLTTIREVSSDSRSIRVIASDGSVDRYGDVLEPGGVVLPNFRRNPIILAQHDSDRPIARCTLIMVQRGQLIATIKFPPAYENPLSDQYLALVKAEVLTGVSVGFLPLEYEPIGGGSYGLRYTSWELLEISLVSIPANPAALVVEKAYRSGAGFEARRAADMVRFAALQRRLGRPIEPPWQLAWAHRQDEKIRDARAGVALAQRAAVTWW